MKFLRKLIVIIQYIFWALSRVNKPHLGDVVQIKDSGKIGFLIQGANNPYWDILIGSDIINDVHKDKFKLLSPLRGRFHRLKQSYEFQKRNWFLIDNNKRNLLDRISYRS